MVWEHFGWLCNVGWCVPGSVKDSVARVSSSVGGLKDGAEVLWSNVPNAIIVVMYSLRPLIRVTLTILFL